MKLVECPHCGEWLAWNLQYCSGCGLPLVGPEAAKALEHARKGRWRSPTQALPLDDDEPGAGDGSPSAQAGLPPAEARPSWRQPLALGTLALALGVAGGGLLLSAWRSSETVTQAPITSTAPTATATAALPAPQVAQAAPSAPTPALPPASAATATVAPVPVPMPAPAAAPEPAPAAGDTRPALAAATAWFEAGARADQAEAMRRFYADAVDYYDRGRLTWPLVAADKSAYLRRWPERDYQLLATTAQPGCGADACQVLLQFRWQVSRDGHWRRGQGSTLLGLRRVDGELRVVSERAG